MKKICYFGIFDPSYNRNRNLIRGLEENGYEVIFCHVDPRTARGIKKFLHLIREARKVKKSTVSCVVVGFPGQTVLWLAWLLFGKKVIFDAFIPIYNATVYDRQKYGPFHPRALKDWFIDWYSMRLAPVVLAHTEAEKVFFVERYGISSKKIITVYIGAVKAHGGKERRRDGARPLCVHFHGGFTKIQGLSHLVDAANLLKHEQVSFQILGSGVEGNLIHNKIREYGLEEKFILPGRVPFTELISQADICIGILGMTRNTDIMVPNKVFEYMAYGKAIITADTSAAREVFMDRRNVLFCKAGDPESIAAAIRTLIHDDFLREKLSEGSYVLYRERFTPKILARGLIRELKRREYAL